MTSDELSEAKYRLELRRFWMDRAKLKREHAFLFRHSTVFITGFITLASIVFSIANAISDSRSAREETQRRYTMESEATKRAAAETERKTSFELLQYITVNYDLIYSQDATKQLRILNAMQPAFSDKARKIVFAQFAESAPTLDGPNVWQREQREADIKVLSEAPTKMPAGTAIQYKLSREQLLARLTGNQRRHEAELLANTTGTDAAAVAHLLISALLPQEDKWSYRFNLYAIVALARMAGGWTGPQTDVDAVRRLIVSGNHRDPTFAKWVDAALQNYRPPKG